MFLFINNDHRQGRTAMKWTGSVKTNRSSELQVGGGGGTPTWQVDLLCGHVSDWQNWIWCAGPQSLLSSLFALVNSKALTQGTLSHHQWLPGFASPVKKCVSSPADTFFHKTWRALGNKLLSCPRMTSKLTKLQVLINVHYFLPIVRIKNIIFVGFSSFQRVTHSFYVLFILGPSSALLWKWETTLNHWK